MKFLVLILGLGILINFKCLKNRKIINLCALTVAFSLLVGCNSTNNQETTNESSNNKAIVSNSYESSDEQEINKESSGSDESDNEENQSSEDNQYIHEEDQNDYDDESSNSDDYDNHDNDYEEDSHENSHIGEKVYIAKGNSYYHKIPNCKYLEGAKTKKVVLSSDMHKYECNCFTNPVEYNPNSGHHSKKHHSSKKHSSGQKVYIAKGNSYYHKSANCKFINGADVSKVDISDVGGKYPCNCMKY